MNKKIARDKLICMHEHLHPTFTLNFWVRATIYLAPKDIPYYITKAKGKRQGFEWGKMWRED